MIKIGNLYDILGAAITTISCAYIWSKLLIKKFNFKDYKKYFILISYCITLILNYNIVNPMYKIMFIIIFEIIVVYLLFKISIKQSIVTTLFTQLLYILPEFLYSTILIYILNIKINMDDYPNILLLGADFFVCLISIGLVNIKYVRRFYNFLYKCADKIRLRTVLICALPVTFIFNAYLISAYYKTSAFYLIFLNNIAIYFVVIILVLSLKKESDFLKINDKYSSTKSSLKEYEDMVDKYKIINHENKNQLMTIRNMCSKDEFKVIKYIDSLINNNIKDNEKIMNDISKIPSGGLRGLIYSKILVMKDMNIEYKVYISKQVRTTQLINEIDDYTMVDVCKIIGVFLDNAIEEVEKIVNKYVTIEIYIEDDYLNISISNDHDNNIDIDRIGKKSYTSKGKGRGYGLLLVREIIERNPKLANEKRTLKNIFTQILKIKM